MTMANKDRPNGFTPIRHLTGGEIRCEEYIVTTGQIIYRGDVVKLVDAGTVEECDAADGVLAIGIAAEYVDDSGSAGGKLIRIYNDPHIVFAVQSTDGITTAADHIGETADHLDTNGSSVTLQSAHEINTVGTNLQFRIIGLVPKVDNAWGEFSEVEVVFNEHQHKDGSGVASV
jgi:hypothetical protein